MGTLWVLGGWVIKEKYVPKGLIKMVLMVNGFDGK
jgi:hypothetical protein